MPSLWADDLDAHRELVLDRLLDAYDDLRHQLGPDAVTLAAVAARAGLARSAIYNYVADKHQLILTHAARAFADAHQRLAAAVEATDGPLDALSAYITETLRIHAATSAAGDEVMAMLTPDERQQFLTLLQPIRALLDDIISQGVADGSFTTEAGPAAELVWATIGGYRVPVATGRLDPETTAAFTIDVVTRGLGAAR